MDRIRRRVPNVIFDIYSYRNGHRRFPKTDHVVKFIDLMPWKLTLNYFGIPVLLKLPRADWILTRGGRFFSNRQWNPYYNHMLNFRFVFPWVKRMGKPILLWDIGIGPLRNTRSIKWARETCGAADMITTRDEESYIWLKKLGVRPKFQALSADPVWLAEPTKNSALKELKRYGLDLEYPYAALNITKVLQSFPDRNLTIDKFRWVVEAAIDSFKPKFAVWLVPTQVSDIDFCQSFARAQSNVRMLPTFKLSHNAVIGFLGRAKLTVGMRYHSVIMAMIGGSPTIAIGYAPKVVELMRQMKMDEWCVRGEDLADLPQRIRLALNHRDKIMELQSRAIPMLLMRAKATDICFSQFVSSLGL
jgi:polysaccharide pyruvyl transferase WcaK-like protein